ncbi:MAG TPA: hypothetical protein VLJ42_03085 [Solirubrobacteraceae bacterium]|nr:hypothetical protein [Solirubrobacteraceae bacterium]
MTISLPGRSIGVFALLLCTAALAALSMFSSPATARKSGSVCSKGAVHHRAGAHKTCAPSKHAAKRGAKGHPRKQAKTHAKHSKKKPVAKPRRHKSAPAVCADGSDPSQSDDGSCQDGSDPVCANGSDPTLASGMTLVCAAGPGASDSTGADTPAICDDGSDPNQSDSGSCANGSDPTCADDSDPTISSDGATLVCPADASDSRN